MAPISESTEINRKADDVFAYLDDVERHGEWQEQKATGSPARFCSQWRELRRASRSRRTRPV